MCTWSQVYLPWGLGGREVPGEGEDEEMEEEEDGVGGLDGSSGRTVGAVKEEDGGGEGESG